MSRRPLPGYDVYENIVIGNFLFGLGAHLGSKGALSAGLCVNLLQQTPLDTRIGDALLMNPSFLRIIEFKRVINDSIKELSRLEMLKSILLSKYPEMEPISREIHWYVESHLDEKKFKTKCTPYLDFNSKEAVGIDLSEFTVKTSMDAQEPPMDSKKTELINFYINNIGNWTTHAGADSGALVISATPEGLIKYIAVESLIDLKNTCRVIIENGQKYAADIQRERVMERSRTLSLDQKRSISRSEGMSL